MAIVEGARESKIGGSVEQILVPAPSGSTRRLVAFGWIQNNGTTSIDVQVRFYTGAAYAPRTITLAAGNTWEFSGRIVLDSTQRIAALVSSGTEIPDASWSWADHE